MERTHPGVHTELRQIPLSSQGYMNTAVDLLCAFDYSLFFMNYNETISHGGSFLRPLFLLRKYFKGVCQLELNTTKTTQPAPELSSSQAGGTITCCTGTDKG